MDSGSASTAQPDRRAANGGAPWWRHKGIVAGFVLMALLAVGSGVTTFVLTTNLPPPAVKTPTLGISPIPVSPTATPAATPAVTVTVTATPAPAAAPGPRVTQYIAIPHATSSSSTVWIVLAAVGSAVAGLGTQIGGLPP